MQSVIVFSLDWPNRINAVTLSLSRALPPVDLSVTVNVSQWRVAGVSRKFLARDTDRERGARIAGCENDQKRENETRARASQPFDRVNERFLAVRRKQQSSLGTRVVPRASQRRPSLLSYHPKHPPLSRSLPARHSAPLTVGLPVSLTLVRAGARETVPPLRLRSIASTKASVNPPPPSPSSREPRWDHAVKTRPL